MLIVSVGWNGVELRAQENAVAQKQEFIDEQELCAR
jgi:hypothetical protein